MKIAICSDLHLEFGNYDIVNDQGADVLILAGDVCTANKFPLYRQFFEKCSAAFNDVVYIMGNHEYYRGDINISANILRDGLSEFSNVHFLENTSVKIGDINFFGGTMWTNMNNASPTAMLYAKRSMNDFRIIERDNKTFTPQDSVELHNDFISKLLDMPKERTIVVSHHSPSFKSCHPKYGNDPMNHAFHSELDCIKSMDHVIVWIHGHTHDPFDYMISKTRVMCNPRGYHGHEKVAAEFKMKYIGV